ncbi:hypothetical protein GDO86_017411 [Hymenochirus boettgeri]|uniref:Promethin n=1 Tax=Hymenochirus boettgeri TaxID=247094 RepID=A0A8T2IM93_9PIPI|nr:hypothetical protein GDO86_017411 [Hymenochirus boettgeri]
MKMASPESLYREKMQDLQKQLNNVMETINSNAKVEAFLNSRVGQYLDQHPFVSFSLLVFVALSLVPVGLFLTVIAGTAIAACIGVLIIEGFVISVGGLVLLCVLGGLVVVSLGVSAVLCVFYVVVSSVLNYTHAYRMALKSKTTELSEEIPAPEKTFKNS